MNSPTRIEDIFNVCIDQMAKGATVEDCLRRYPAYADELRPMLETGQIVRRALVPNAEGRMAQNRVRFVIAGAVESTFAAPTRAAAGSSRTPRLLLQVAALILVFFAGAFVTMLFNRGSHDLIPGQAQTQEATITTTDTTTPTPTETLTITPTATETVTPTATSTPQPTQTPAPPTNAPPATTSIPNSTPALNPANTLPPQDTPTLIPSPEGFSTPADTPPTLDVPPPTDDHGGDEHGSDHSSDSSGGSSGGSGGGH